MIYWFHTRTNQLDLTSGPSANWGQIIADYLFYPSIIGNYWQIFAIIAIICLQKVLLLFAIIVTGLKTLIIAIVQRQLLQ